MEFLMVTNSIQLLTEKATIALLIAVENHADHALVFRNTNFDIDSIVPNMAIIIMINKTSAIYALE